MTQEIELEYTVEEKDFIHFKMNSLVSAKFRIVTIIIFSVVVISLILNTLVSISKPSASFNISDIMPLIFFLVIAAVIYFRVKKTYRDNAYFHNVMKIRLNPQEINFHGEGYDMTTDWSKIHKVEDRSNYYLFFTSQQIANIVSKSSISADDQASINQMLNQISGLNFIQK